ncbi:MAG: Glutamyl-tRNAGlu reductase, dimerization domain, partial [Bacteroidetes bacterium]|nr:Glutamyl-tRNAGlu reductase, dimerization domain [Bacteroidota bacterium]
TRRIVNKILHQPLTTLKQGAENGGAEAETSLRIRVLRELFGMTKSGRHGD